ncbi:MAG TPA: PKD domain-containing protein, partial [Bacteroidia bacterium]|nr:PKD domain-containing protein [Bacteroidia bacterium]
MNKGVLKTCIKVFVAFMVLANGEVFSQAKSITEQTEPVLAHWKTTMGHLRRKLSLSKDDFQTFVRFNKARIDSDKINFLRKIVAGKVTASNVDGYMAAQESQYVYLYKQFEEIKKEYPSSVDEFSAKELHKPLATCNPGCTNIDFENGTLSGWNAYYATNNSPGTGPTSSFDITGVTGGACGPGVTGAANDPNTNTGGGNDYQVEIMTGGNDPLAPSVPRVSPFGGKYSVRVGDSTNPNQGVAILNQTFMVTAANTNFTYQYAVFLENPNHPYYEQPFFNVALLDQNGDTIPHCGSYNVVSQSGIDGFKSVYYPSDGDSVYYKNWTVVFASLKAYIGQCVTIQFEAVDCALGGHFGYAYVDASCSSLGLITSSPALCGQKYISLTAPPGGAQYLWSGPTNGIVGTDTTQTIKVDSAGNYQVIVTPVTGKFCADTITINIPKAPGPPPVPSFTADTVCVGSATNFTNTSTPGPGAGVSFYWDFYNLGTTNDSTANPTWTYNTAGTYTVKLTEVNNGCGTDTLIKVVVDPSSTISFTAADSGCSGSAVTFTNTSNGGSPYVWNFGDGTTSSSVSPSHTYPSPNTYTVTLKGLGASKCGSDSATQVITVSAGGPTLTITGNAGPICPGASDVLTVKGGGFTDIGYQWSTGAVSIFPGPYSITVNPTVTTTYSVTGIPFGGGGCGGSATFTVTVGPGLNDSIVTKPDTICSGQVDSLIVVGTPGTSYSWNNGATTDTIVVSPTATTTYSVNVGGGSCPTNLTATVTVLSSSSPVISLSRDSICYGDTATLRVSGGSSYSWNTGATTTSIVVAPAKTTTYSVVVHSKCRADTTLTKVLHILPFPNPSITGKDTICGGTADLLTAKGGIKVTKYIWSTGATTDTTTVSPTVTTIYTVTESNGSCSSSVSKKVTVITNIPPSLILYHDSICPGVTDSLNVSGTGTYVWSSTPTSSSSGATTGTIIVNPTVTTTYSVSVTSYCLGTSTLSTVLHVVPTPVPTITAPKDSLCSGSSLVLTANGGTSGLTKYVWNTAQTTSSITVTPGFTATYTVTEKNASCTANATFVVTVGTVVKPSITADDNNLCAGTFDTLTATGSGYIWNNGATTSTIIVNPLTSPTIYSVTYTKTICYNDTTLYDTVHVNQIPQPTASASNNLICAGTPDVLSAGGTPGGTYVWQPGGATSANITVSPTNKTTYTLTETKSGCSNKDTVTVSIIPVPTFSITSSGVPCTGENLTLTASSGGNSYQWSNGMTGSSITFKPTSSGEISVKIITPGGCLAKDSTFMNVYVTKTVVACCDTTIAFGASAYVNASGVSSYAWTPTGTVGCVSCASTVVTPSVTTTYTVTGTDSNGCQSAYTLIISIECQDFEVPNVFTPNNDGINDLFIIHAEHEPAYTIEIYNRWGVKVFTSNNPLDYWNGKIDN